MGLELCAQRLRVLLLRLNLMIFNLEQASPSNRLHEEGRFNDKAQDQLLVTLMALKSSAAFSLGDPAKVVCYDQRDHSERNVSVLKNIRLR